MKAHPAKPALLIAVMATLAACNGQASNVRISRDDGSPTAQTRPRSEPIFYNGKTYQLDFAPGEAGAFHLAVGGMSAKQEKDAVAVATSSLRYFACPEGKTGKLLDEPAYTANMWKMQARCG